MYKEILKFWFEEIEPASWWKKDESFDQLLIERFSEVHARAVRCELFEWRSEPEGRLAEIIVLDQFSRNMFRGSALAFANDSLSLALSQEVVTRTAIRYWEGSRPLKKLNSWSSQAPVSSQSCFVFGSLLRL